MLILNEDILHKHHDYILVITTIINNNDLTTQKVNITPASGFAIEGDCYRVGKIICASFGLTKTTTGSINVTHGTAYVTGFPTEAMATRIDGQHWPNGVAQQPTSVRFSIYNNALRGWYNGANEVINNAQPIMINIAYIAK